MKSLCYFELLELAPNESGKVFPLAMRPVAVDLFDVLLPAAEVDAVLVLGIDESKELLVVGLVPLGCFVGFGSSLLLRHRGLWLCGKKR